MKNPLTHAQKSVVRNDVTRAIGQLCDAWPDATAAEQSRGYPTGAGNGSGGIGSHGDPTAHSSLKADKASLWLATARRDLALLLKMGHDKSWVGPFNPPQMRSSLIDAGMELVELWPKNVMRLFHRLYDLANEGIKEWPPTPRRGEKIGDVVVGERRNSTIEVCFECHRPIGANPADPLRRIDGEPYHEIPCHGIVERRRNRRAAVQ